MARLHQITLVISSVLLSWLGMQVVHELGHILGALATGGEVIKVVLHPLAISRTDVSPNKAPLVVVWAGPIAGCLLPILVYVVCRLVKFQATYLLQFFAGFCLIANGVYIGIGSFERIGDAGVMLANGSRIWQLWLFGLVALSVGLKLWDGLGPKFGLGSSQGAVCRQDTYVVTGILLCAVALEFLISPTE